MTEEAGQYPDDPDSDPDGQGDGGYQMQKQERKPCMPDDPPILQKKVVKENEAGGSHGSQHIGTGKLFC